MSTKAAEMGELLCDSPERSEAGCWSVRADEPRVLKRLRAAQGRVVEMAARFDQPEV
jgi:hypothetical protein